MRISFDLDEVLFVSPDDFEVEEPLRFPLNRMFPERLRKGTPYLINELQRRGFEVWVYTSSFRSEVYIRTLFRYYGVKFDEIVNGFRHNDEVQGSNDATLPQKMPTRYRISLHIDDEDTIINNARTYGFKALKICEPDPGWTDKVINEAERIRALEEKNNGDNKVY